MNKNMKCLRCESKMEYIGTEEFQLGRSTFFLRDLPHFLAGSLTLSIYKCRECGKVEFFSTEPMESDEEDHIAQTRCPACGHAHDMDYPKCPHCGHDYRED